MVVRIRKFWYSIKAEGPWCSGLAHPPVTRKIVGSNPIGPAKRLNVDLCMLKKSNWFLKVKRNFYSNFVWAGFFVGLFILLVVLSVHFRSPILFLVSFVLYGIYILGFEPASKEGENAYRDVGEYLRKLLKNNIISFEYLFFSQAIFLFISEHKGILIAIICGFFGFFFGLASLITFKIGDEKDAIGITKIIRLIIFLLFGIFDTVSMTGLFPAKF
jgi:hypothetical protein